MKANEIAQSVKDYLVDLAVNDKLPLDLTQLSVTELSSIIEDTPEDRKVCWWSNADVEIALGWLNDDREEDGEEPIPFTEELGHSVLDKVEGNFDAEHGITWDSIRDELFQVLTENDMI